MPVTTTTILLARHGETDWNAERRYQGHADRPLNAAGRLQARELAQSLLSEGVSAIYSSDLLRARETAEIVAAWIGLPVITRDALREIDVGEFSGLTHEEIVARWPEVPARTDALGYGWTRGESFEALHTRIAAELRRIAGVHPGETVLVVGHGAMMRVVLAARAGLDLSAHRQVVGPIANGAVERIELPATDG